MKKLNLFFILESRVKCHKILKILNFWCSLSTKMSENWPKIKNVRKNSEFHEIPLVQNIEMVKISSTVSEIFVIFLRKFFLIFLTLSRIFQKFRHFLSLLDIFKKSDIYLLRHSAIFGAKFFRIISYSV